MMNVNQLIISALSDMGLEVYPNFYSGDDEEYITFSYLDERPEFWADDEPIYDGTYVRVSLRTRQNPQNYKKQIRKRLRAAGFTVTSTAELYEEDTNYVQVAVDAEIAGIVNDEEEI